jgi:hypothetical protein
MPMQGNPLSATLRMLSRRSEYPSRNIDQVGLFLIFELAVWSACIPPIGSLVCGAAAQMRLFLKQFLYGYPFAMRKTHAGEPQMAWGAKSPTAMK